MDMKGDTLYPLNILHTVHPELYEKKFAKYAWRPQVPQQKIPVLECLWNDVLHLTPVHPTEVWKVLQEAGYAGQFDYRCYEIDPWNLEPEKSIIYLNKLALTAERMTDADFQPYDPATLDAYSIVPEETKEYYKRCVQKGAEPLLFHRIVHVLYKGSIDVSGLKIISP
jgi:hypothetical protein